MADDERAYDNMTDEGYWCVVCGRFLEADDYGMVVHDFKPHPEYMDFKNKETMQ